MSNQDDAPPAAEFAHAITVVSGLPRSGTSLMMQMLQAGGLPPLTDEQRTPDESNPRGYLEFERVKQLKTDRAWLADARGHAVKIIHALLPDLPTTGNERYRVIFMRRRLEEVVASQRAMLARSGKTGAALDDARLIAMFQAQLTRVESWLRERPAHFAVLEVAHGDLLADPLAGTARVSAFLGGGLDTAAMVRAVDPTLWRQRG